MRNLLKYPITKDELMAYCDRQLEELSYEKTGLIGDMRPLYYEELKNLVEMNPKLNYLIDELMRDNGKN